MRRIKLKHNMFKVPKLIEYIEYIARKLDKYGWAACLLNLLLAGSPLLSMPNSELCRIITKTLHYNLTVIIAVQTTKFALRNNKRRSPTCCSLAFTAMTGATS